MRCKAVTLVCFGLALAGCGSTRPAKYTEFDRPNELLALEIQSRINQIPYKTYQDLVFNLSWLVKQKEYALPGLLAATEHENPKMRCNAIWAIGRIRDIRTIPYLHAHLQDPDLNVQMETATALLGMNDDKGLEVLVSGLENKVERYRRRCMGILQDWAKREYDYDYRRTPEENKEAIQKWMAWCNQVRGRQVFPLGELKEENPEKLADPPE